MRFHESSSKKVRGARITLMLVAALLLGGIGAASAQMGPPGDGPDPVRLAARFLNLSDGQLEQWGDILRRRQGAVQPIAGEIQRLERELHRLLSTDAPDPAAVGQVVIRTSELRRQIQEIVQASGAELLATLGDEQISLVDEVAEAAPLVPAVHSFQALALI